MIESIRIKIVALLNWLMSTKWLAVRAECKLLDIDAKLPTRKRITDAAYDLYSIENIIIPAHGFRPINTNAIVVVPPGYYITIEARSGLAAKGITPTRGIIDATYTDKIIIILNNNSDEPYIVNKGDRVAQMLINKQIHLRYEMVDQFSNDYNIRGNAGWGSGGR
jgi:dUTP pyrophosphatase